jgi:parallel beta-helix repeat protein
MSTTTTPLPRSGAGTARGPAVAAAAVLVFAALPAGVAAAEGAGPRVWSVREGQSIQAAVDRAESGDTIRIAAGEYEEAVCVDGKGLTIEGAGPDETTITWPEWTDVGDLPDVSSTPCWEATEVADGEDVEDDLSDNVSALFFLDPDRRVTVSGLGTANHPAHGIAAWGADGFIVSDTEGVGHDRYGILAADSTNVRIVGNREQGIDRNLERAVPGNPDAGTAGISIGDSDGARARISGNRVQGYNLGIFLRESRGGRVHGNHLTGNCIGILVFDDAATEIPDTSRAIEGGQFTIKGNTSVANNRFCVQGRDGEQRISGVGMAVVNAAGVRIAGNTVDGNHPTMPPPAGVVVPPGAPPLTFPSAGLALLTFPPPPSAPPGGEDPGQVTGVHVVANDFGDNLALAQGAPGPVPMDVFVSNAQIPFLGDPGALEFRENDCDGSVRPDACGAAASGA